MMGLSSYCLLFHFGNNKHILWLTILINVCRSDSKKTLLIQRQTHFKQYLILVFFSLEFFSLCVIRVLKNRNICKWDICIISMSYFGFFFLQIIIRYTNFNKKFFILFQETLIHNTVWILNIYRTIVQVSWIKPWLNSFKNIFYRLSLQ